MGVAASDHASRLPFPMQKETASTCSSRKQQQQDLSYHKQHWEAMFMRPVCTLGNCTFSKTCAADDIKTLFKQQNPALRLVPSWRVSRNIHGDKSLKSRFNMTLSSAHSASAAAELHCCNSAGLPTAMTIAVVISLLTVAATAACCRLQQSDTNQPSYNLATACMHRMQLF